MSRLQEKFFRATGITWWTDINRATAGRMISAEMGMRANTAYEFLPANYRHVLGLHGIDAARWEAIRQAGTRVVVGKTYVTPDMIRSLPDSAVAGLGRTPDDGRRELEMAVRRFFADETSYGMIETDARSRRTSTWGIRPGTIAGESIRFAMQFKAFPVAFTQRVIGRGLYGQRADANKFYHMGSIIAGMTMAGYMSMTMKDLVKGYWPPRRPLDPKTWGAALVQGGGLGIYGDFYLFGQANRFGNMPIETAVGPFANTISDLITLGQNWRDVAAGKVSGEEKKAPFAQTFDFALKNTPFVNLAYVRPALDFLVLNSIREAISPRYLKRQESRRRTEYDQRTMRFPPFGDRQMLK